MIKGKNEIFSDKFSTHFFELKKISKHPKTSREQWLRFINADSEEVIIMKKIIIFTSAILIMLCCLCSCGNAAKNADITSEWKIEQMTVNGKTVSGASLQLDSNGPKFSCKDGKNVTFALNGKTHNGTVTENNGVYLIAFDDSAKEMEARIGNGRLVMKIKDSDTIELIFKLK